MKKFAEDEMRSRIIELRLNVKCTLDTSVSFNTCMNSRPKPSILSSSKALAAGGSQLFKLRESSSSKAIPVKYVC